MRTRTHEQSHSLTFAIVVFNNDDKDLINGG